MRPRGSPPIPSARSSASEPVEIAPMETAARSFIFITAPLPNCRSIWPRATSRACSRSTYLAQVKRRRLQPRRPPEAEDGDVREPGPSLALVDAEALESAAEVLREPGR